MPNTFYAQQHICYSVYNVCRCHGNSVCPSVHSTILTDVIGEYLKLFPRSWEYSPQLSALGNIVIIDYCLTLISCTFLTCSYTRALYQNS